MMKNTKSQLCHIKVPLKLYERIKRIAIREDKKLSEVFAIYLEKGLQNNNKLLVDKFVKKSLKNKDKVVSKTKDK
jgi:hypothetical protein